MIMILCHRGKLSVENLRTGTSPIAIRKIEKSGTRFFSFWRVKFSLAEPERKKSRATFFSTANSYFPEPNTLGSLHMHYRYDGAVI